MRPTSLFQVRPKLLEFRAPGGGWCHTPLSADTGWLHFYIVTFGECVLDRPQRPPVPLKAGDVLLLPKDAAHILRAEEAADAAWVHGAAYFQAIPENIIRVALPDQMILRTGADFALAAALHQELSATQPGTIEIAVNLVSALLLMTLRTHFETLLDHTGLPLLLGPRLTAQAFLAMLEDPARKWTLDSLAATAATSRATLIRTFKKATGLPPLAFLAALRLDLARQRILCGQDSLAQIAEDVGYSSETALSRAFLRRFGVRPGRLTKPASPD